MVLLLAAGHGTTTHLLGNGLLALLVSPDQWQLLCREPSIIPTAVTELLRYDGPVQSTTRLAFETFEVAGRTIREGEQLTLLLGSANRDPDAFPDPDRLDVRRSSAKPMTFGHGLHACLGATLVRAEGEVAFGEITRRFPNLHADIRTPRWIPSLHFRGLETLPVTLH